MSEPNAPQVEYWNHAVGSTWVEMQSPLDRQLEPLGRRAMAALDLKPGERVLDVGCGGGTTSLALAALVAPEGQVTGVDISRPLLETARRNATGVAGVQFVEADAQTYPFAPGGFDAAFSRFGVMFFADPAAAFANIRKALKPGGRLAFVCWRAPAENPIMVLPMAAASPHLPPAPPPEPDAPGPFAFADANRVRDILGAAGFAGVEVQPFDLKIGSGGLDTALEVALKVGPLGRQLRENPDQREVVIAAVRAALAPHETPDGVKLGSATWIVTATA
ncbi:MAG: class I SAM-dependent methyltransferase [Alphaproteobacteria bacterium]|nr:class I SAM-dependent methyltransferase [Alphaproteobacteria bacterium]MBU1513016.1 class I SAM-dependent methyltransferase [Alphaproteobacteria bacterium]MBU2095124.1 class I SAM-dependent methyltransferase [Alphaproteobacteria bacterium]MBU2152135.1 class I SAM-dependent methyltransferase [Alphaproteobacteria bacterium]MBU2306375.1 class I SAM-dependent methyltransferase [Alphaproteobacteria bacterium]